MATKTARYSLNLKTHLLGRKVVISTIAVNADLPEVQRRRLAKTSGYAFETLVFAVNKNGQLDRRRYKTYDEAFQGHSDLVAKWKKTPRKVIKEMTKKLVPF